MASSIIETPLAPGSWLTHPSLVARASDGAIWTVGANVSGRAAIQRTDAQGVSTVKVTATPSESYIDLIAGKHGEVWALAYSYSYETQGSTLLRLTADHTSSTTLPTEFPIGLTLDAEGDARVSFRTYAWRTTVREYDGGTVAPKGNPLISDGNGTVDIATASDGAIWLSEGVYGGGVVRIATDGSSTRFSVNLSQPTPLAPGSEGRVWIGGRDEANNPVLVNITPGGQLSRIGLGSDVPRDHGGNPRTIAPAPDGSVWYVDEASARIGHATLAGDTSLVPMLRPSDYHPGLTSDGGSGVYFTDINTNTISHLTTDAPDTGVVVRARSFNSVEGIVPAATTIATFSTPDASAFSFDFIARYQVDGQLPHDGVILADGNGGYVVQAGTTTDILTPGPHFVTVTIIDAKHGNTVGSSATGFSVATISDSLITVTGRTFQAYVGAAYTGPVARIDDPSPIPGPAGQTTTTIDWGDGTPKTTVVTPFTNLPSGYLPNDVGSPASGHVYATPGTYTVVVSAKHGTQTYVETSTAKVSVAPVQNLKGVTAGFSAGHLARVLVATFTTSPMAAASTYLASVDWAGGHTIGEIVAKADHYEVYASINFATWGQIPLTVSVNPATGGLATSAKLDALVTPAPITASILTIKTPYSGLWGGNVATFTSFNPNAKPSDFRATVQSEDGGSWTAQVLNDGSGGFTIYASHAFTQTGILKTTVKIDNVNAAGDIANAATLAGTSQVALPLAYDFKPYYTPFAMHTGEQFSLPLATFNPADPTSTPQDYKATIDWGDGTTSTGFLTSGQQSFGGGLWIGGNHQYSVAGNLTITVTLDGVGKLAGQQKLSFAAMIGHPNVVMPMPANGTAVLNTPYTGPLATFTAPWGNPATASDFVARISWDDGSPDTIGTVTPDGFGGFNVSAPHTFTTGGSHQFGITVAWADGKVLEQPSTWYLPIQVIASPIWLENAVFSGDVSGPTGGVVASFVDSKPNDVAKYSATIDWGDGTTSDGVVSNYATQFVVYGTHKYATPGTYTTKTTIMNSGAVSGVAVGAVTIKSAVGTPGNGDPVGSTPDPTVTSSFVQILKKGVAKLFLNYSGSLDTAKAADKTRYAIKFAGKDGKFGTKDDKSIKLNAVNYNATTKQVTLTPKGAFTRTAKFRVAIRGEATVTALVASR